MHRARLLPAIAAIAVLLSAACPGRFDPAKPDVVFVVVDTLRADHLGVYGSDRGASPRLDALARGGSVFDAAWAAAPWTLPSVMSIMTSRLPSSHRVESDGLKLSADIPTLASVVHGAGYATGGFVSNIYVSGLFGFDRGFDTFQDFGVTRPGYRPETRMEPPADRVTTEALDWLGGQGRRPVFLFVHYFDPHWPYEPPERFRALYPDDYQGPLAADYDSISKFQAPAAAMPEDYRRFLLDRYDGEIRFVDEQIGRLIDGVAAAGRAERAWIIVTADHGEEFKDHGSVGHGRRLYEEVVRVPLIVVPPRSGSAAPPAPARVGRPVSGLDLFPTIAALAGAGASAGTQGASLLPLIGRGGDPNAGPEVDRPVISETIRLNAHLKAIRQASLKLIHSMDANRSELYDLSSDPREQKDLAARDPGDRARLVQNLFARVDYLSGGWNLRWTSDGTKHRFQGQLRVSGGIFRTVVPLFHDTGKYNLDGPDTLNFTDDGQTGASGLSFTTAPDDAPVEFYLMVDGRQAIDRTWLGGRDHPPGRMPFSLEGRPTVDAAFQKPPRAGTKTVGFFVWRLRPAAPEQGVVLDDEIRDRLRSLGYVH